MASLFRRQSGFADIAAGTNSIGVGGLPSYVASRSLLVFTLRGGDQRPDGSLVRGQKNGANSLLFTRNASPANSITIDWELYEFDAGVQIQDINFTGNGSTGITAVTQARSFIVSSGYSVTGGVQSDEDTVRFSFASSISVSHTTSGVNAIGTLQVVDYPNCNVQSFLKSVASGTSWDQGITPVIMNRTLLWASMFYGGGAAELQFNVVFRIELQASGNVRGNRSVASVTNHDITVFVCQFLDWAVQRGAQSQSGGTSLTDVLIDSVNIDRSMSKTVSEMGAGHSYCESTATSDAFDEVSYKAFLIDATHLRLQRSNSTPSNVVSWEVAEHLDYDDIMPLF